MTYSQYLSYWTGIHNIALYAHPSQYTACSKIQWTGCQKWLVDQLSLPVIFWWLSRGAGGKLCRHVWVSCKVYIAEAMVSEILSGKFLEFVRKLALEYKGLSGVLGTTIEVMTVQAVMSIWLSLKIQYVRIRKSLWDDKSLVPISQQILDFYELFWNSLMFPRSSDLESRDTLYLELSKTAHSELPLL